LGEIYYFNNILKTQITYIADWQNFSPEIMQKNSADCPIILQGGGNLGDIWHHHQRFKESIIKGYPNQPIIILPQTIYFRDAKKLDRSKKYLTPTVT
jgi:pyruvyl transferase EpsO